VVTRGHKPLIVSGSHLGKVIQRSFEIPKLDKSQIKDTNGAGDSFVGGFLSQIAMDHNIESAVRAGTFCSRTVL
jgi:adenosine kinase